MSQSPSLVITETDLDRLQLLLEQQERGSNTQLREMLEQELARARVTRAEDIPPTVVTMNSTVVFVDEDTGAQRQVTLCYPRDARSDAGRVSILAPIGSALLGLSVGQAIQWPVPGGRTRTLRILAVPYQPEAAGHSHL